MDDVLLVTILWILNHDLKVSLPLCNKPKYTHIRWQESLHCPGQSLQHPLKSLDRLNYHPMVGIAAYQRIPRLKILVRHLKNDS